MPAKRPVRVDAATIVRQIDAELERVAGRVVIEDEDDDELDDGASWNDDLGEIVEHGNARYAVGDLVMIEWDGAWYDGAVIAIRGTKYRVAYDGWDASWDEDVAPARLRLLVTARAPKAQKPQPQPQPQPKPKRKPKRRAPKKPPKRKRR